MLTHPTLDQLRALKLDGMAPAFVDLEAQEEVRNLTHAEWLALLLDREVANRNTRRFQTRLRRRHFGPHRPQRLPLELDGPSMRKIKAAEAAEPPAPPAATTTADGKPAKGAKK
jgi:hypothetical protein